MLKQEVSWAEISPSEHFVQIYENDELLLDALETFVIGGLTAGECVISIATKAHRNALENRLTARGIDVSTCLGGTLHSTGC